MDIHDERLAAYHEGGHAVMARQLGLPVKFFLLRGNKRGGNIDWIGKVGIDACCLKERPEDHWIKIAFAGPLCAVRIWCAEHFASHNGRTPEEVAEEVAIAENSVSDILDGLLTALGFAQVMGNPRPIYREVSFEVRGQRGTAKVCLGVDYGDIECIEGRLGTLDRDVLLPKLREVKTVVERPDFWAAVSRLAKRVMAAKTDEHNEKCLDEAEVREALEG